MAGTHARSAEMRAEPAALAGPALDVERGAMPRQRVLHDREAQARAAGLAGTAAIDTIEALGEPRQVLGRDADAGVLDVEGGAFGRAMPAQPHRAARGRVAD